MISIISFQTKLSTDVIATWELLYKPCRFANLLPGIIDSGRHVGFVRLDGRVEKEKYGLAQHQVSRSLQPLEGFFIQDINDYINYTMQNQHELWNFWHFI